MEVTLVNCPKCGHSVNSAAGVCAYCGAAILKEEAKQQTEEKMPADEIQSSKLVIPLQQEAKTQVIEKPEEVPELNMERKEPDLKDLPAVSQSAIKSHEPLSEATHGKTEEEFVIKLSENMQTEEQKQTVIRETSQNSTGILTVKAEVLERVPTPPGPESVGEYIQEDTKIDGETENLSKNAPQKAEEQAKTEISEMSEVMTSPTPETSLPLDNIVAQAKAAVGQDSPSVSVEDSTLKQPIEVKPEASEDTIMLELPNEVQTPVNDLPDSNRETIQRETAEEITEIQEKAIATEKKTHVLPPKQKVRIGIGTEASSKQKKKRLPIEALKIEKAAQEMVEAVKKQKAALAKAKESNKQKPTPVIPERLKRKKVVSTRGQTLKKKKEVQSNLVATAKKEETAAFSPKPEDSHRMIERDLQTKSKITDLLKKYEGQVIRINYDNSAAIKEAELKKVNDEFFSVFVKDTNLLYNHPQQTILTVIENKDETGSGDPAQKVKSNVVIKVIPTGTFFER